MLEVFVRMLDQPGVPYQQIVNLGLLAATSREAAKEGVASKSLSLTLIHTGL